MKIKKILTRVMFAVIIFAPTLATEVSANELINNWWPVDGVTVSDFQPFKATLSNQDIANYTMYWQVDGGQSNIMANSFDVSPHKEMIVDLSGWNWKGVGPYMIQFVAQKHNGEVIATKSFQIFVENKKNPVITEPVITPAVNPVVIPVPSPTKSISTSPTPSPLIQTWWPIDGSIVQGTQAFKVVIPNKDVQSYTLYWKVGDGSLVKFENDYKDVPHKETAIDFTNWTWAGRGPYVIDLVAQENGKNIATSKISIYNGGVEDKPPVIQTIAKISNVLIKNPLSVLPLYIDPNSNAANQITLWESTRPEDAKVLQKIADAPQSRWFGGWNTDTGKDVSDYILAAEKINTLPILVLYNIPQRDCGSYSAGGSSNAKTYEEWIRSIQTAIGNNKAVIILEPDALAGMDCLSSTDKDTRIQMLQKAVTVLKSGTGTTVYVDAGNPHWQSVETMSDRLTRAGIQTADGFSLNVSNYFTVEDNTNYGDSLSRFLGNKHYVIDTSRNGQGPDQNKEWCNPSGRALGQRPTTITNNTLVDALLWIKSPGESDGTCNGGPSAGVWWADYALGLATRASY